MAKDDMFKIIYIILKELYEHMKEGTRVPFCDISAERFQINEGYWVTIICELSEQGYISGIKVRNTKTGKVVGGVDDINIAGYAEPGKDQCFQTVWLCMGQIL